MELIPLGPGFAAEVRGAGMADVAGSDAVYIAVRAAFEEHSVLVFRKQAITNELQMAFSCKFGPLEIAKAASRGEGTPFSILTNVEPDGTLVPPGHKEELRAKANQLWHTDSCFKIPPALTSSSAVAGSVARLATGAFVGAEAFDTGGAGRGSVGVQPWAPAFRPEAGNWIPERPPFRLAASRRRASHPPCATGHPRRGCNR